MALAFMVDGVRGRCGRLSVVSVLFILLVVLLLAHASPPDPVWVAGIYDGADYDNVVETLSATDTMIFTTRPALPGPLTASGALVAGGISFFTAISTSALRPRSPPPA